MINTIDGLVDALGGAKAVANRLGCEQIAGAGRLGCKRNAVAMWSVRGFIPPGWHHRLFVMIWERRLCVDPQLFDMPPDGFDVFYQVPPPPVLKPPRSRGRRAV